MPNKLTIIAVLSFVAAILRPADSGTYTPRTDIGYPAGLIPDCPGVMKNATISPSGLQQLRIAIHRLGSNGQILRDTLPIMSAAKYIGKDKHIDLRNKKTVLYTVGFFDSSAFPHSQAIGNAYVRRGYNVLIAETLTFLIHIYPKSARLAKTIGNKLGEFLVRLTKYGLSEDNLELVGISLGAHIAGYTAKHFYSATGRKPYRLTGLDPAGPCFRNLPPDHRLKSTDAQKVDVIHTNIDGFGIAERLGHIDFYVNGGEYQPNDIPYIPCLTVCSHLRAMIYWWQALEHPKRFIAMKCDSVQDARFAKCFNNSETNYLGLETDFDKTGIYYLATHNEFPYYRGKDGLKEDNEIYTLVTRNINSDDRFVV